MTAPRHPSHNQDFFTDQLSIPSKAIKILIHYHTEFVSLGSWLIIFIISDSLYPNTVFQLAGFRILTGYGKSYRLSRCSNPQSFDPSVLLQPHVVFYPTWGTYHRPLKVLRILFQLGHGVGLASRALYNLACPSGSRPNVFKYCP